MAYKVKEHLKPVDLKGISSQQIDDHWKLYEGYVKQANTLSQELEGLRLEGKGVSALYSDRRRRFGFEFAGMVLHELYFGNLKSGIELDKDSEFAKVVREQFGSVKSWLEDFVNTGKTRSVGWAVCYMDPETGDINNHFIQLHEEGHIPSYNPILVMDVWEHAYMVDHQAGGRADYIASFMENINWDVVYQRYNEAKEKLVTSRG